MLFLRPLDRSGNVVLLAFTRFELSAARTRATEVEAQRGDVRVFQTACGAEDDFVVQRAAAGRQRMADHGHASRILQLAIERLEPAGAAVEIDVTQRFRIHDASLTMMRSASTRTSC